MDGMDDLVQFLRARLDEDEQTARDTAWNMSTEIDNPWEARPAPDEADGWEIWSKGRFQLIRGTNEADAVHIARHDPARVLAEVDAKRQILGLHVAAEYIRNDPFAGCTTCSWRDYMEDLHVRWPCPTLRLLALPYAGHPDYREEWKPQPPGTDEE